MNRFTKSFWDKTWSLIWRDCKVIRVTSGKCRLNYKCHINAYHEAITSNHNEIALVWYQMPDSGNPSIHFVNFDGEKYIDNTIGYLAEKTSYYLIRMIHKDEFENDLPWNSLLKVKESYQQNASFLERVFGDTSM